MEIVSTQNLLKVLNDSHSTKFQDHKELEKQYGTAIPALFASVLVILCFVNSSVKKFASSGQKIESSIQDVPLTELFKTFVQHNFAPVPAIGYLLRKYDGAVKFTIGIYKMVFIGKPSMIQKLFLSPNPGHLSKPPEFEKLLTESLQGNLGMLKSNVWKVHRSVLARAFTNNCLKEQVKVFEDYAKKLVFSLDESVEIQSKSEVSQRSPSLCFSQAISSHVFYIILHIASGKNLIGSHVETTRFCQLIERFKGLMLYRGERPWLLLDLFWFFHPKRREMNSARVELESMFAKVLEKARKEVSIDSGNDEDMAGKSLIELMVKAGFSDGEIFKEFLFFIVVSNESVAPFTKILLFHLALNPELQEKCRLEVCQMFEKLHISGSTELSVEMLNDMQYLEKCIKETVRLYPTLVVQARMLESPLIIDEQTTISPGTRVYISAYHLHRDPKYYPEPEIFDPERFSPENEKKRGKCEYMGFADGPRNCIGKKSAILELKMLVSYILYNFEAYTDNTREKFEIDMGPNWWPLADPKVELRRRN